MRKFRQREKLVETTLSLVDAPTFKCATSSSIDAFAFKHTTSSFVDVPTFKRLTSNFVDALAFQRVTSSFVDVPTFKHLTSSFVDALTFKSMTSSFVHAPPLSTQFQILLMQLLSSATSSSRPPLSKKL
jgi:hypothetical protein